MIAAVHTFNGAGLHFGYRLPAHQERQRCQTGLPQRTVDPAKSSPMMQAEGYRRFKMQQHIDLWKAEKARDPKLGFSSLVFGKER
jgi:hypothetical protein